MSKELKPGMWCDPQCQREWSAVLDIAVSLGLRSSNATSVYSPLSRYIGVTDKREVLSCGHCSGKSVHVSDFIAAMYAEAERQNKIPDHMVYIDPEASPSGIPFEVALMYAKLGRRVSRKHDPKGDVMWVEGDVVMTSHRHFYVSDEDMLATDWYVLPEEKNP